MKKINLAITGCLGRMGQQLVKSSKSTKNFKLVSVTENRVVNKRVSGLKPQLNSKFAFKNANIIIDFTIPKCTLEVLKIAFADRQVVTADPDFVDVPTDRLLSKAYAAERRHDIDLVHAKKWSAGVTLPESPTTTHVTVADGDGNIVAATQTINSTFGARIMIPGTGIIPNNYMFVFDPHPGNALSIAPGKRVTTSMSPIMALQDGNPILALGLPGGLRIFGSAMQALINKIDHGMNVQAMVEAPRIWTQGHGVEIEDGYPSDTEEHLAKKGHLMTRVPHVGGGMNAIEFSEDGTMIGASCWRADGTPVGISGGYAREGSRFWPDQVG